MSLNATDVKKIAHLARLALSEEEIPLYATQLSNILDFVAEMNRADTSHIDPIANPLDLSQPLREDQVTESNQRELFQKIAPAVLDGLYLVPKVIENEE